MAMAHAAENTMPQMMSCIVFHRLALMSLLTSRWDVKLAPHLPWTKSVSQVVYWCVIGLSSPSSLRSRPTSSLSGLAR